MATVTVSNTAQLNAAVSAAKANTTIILKAGNYGDVYLSGGHVSTLDNNATITFQSADPNNKAVFSGLTVTNTKNLVFDGIEFDYSASHGASLGALPFAIRNSNNITVKNSVFDGDHASGVSSIKDGYGTGTGLYVDNCNNITIDNNTAYNFFRGFKFTDSKNLAITNNDVSDMGYDGLGFSAVQGVLIEGNFIHNFDIDPKTKGHQDKIQFWTNGQNTPTTDVIIRGNIIDTQDGVRTQSIFIRNEAMDSQGKGNAMLYQNFLIEDNFIHNAHSHGITASYIKGLVIRNNTMLQNPDSGDPLQGIDIPTINIGARATGVQIKDNIVHGILGSGYSESGNVIVQNTAPKLPNYYGDLFVNGLVGGQGDYTDFVALPGSPLDKSNAGSSLTQFDPTPSQLAAVILDQPGTELQKGVVSFDVSNIYGSNGSQNTSGAKVVWDFGDGTKGTGLNDSHAYSSPGIYNVKATVTLKNGQTVVTNKLVEVKTPYAIVDDFNSGLGDQSGNVNTASTSGNVKIVNDGGSKVAKLTANSYISYAGSAELLDNTAYTVMVDFRKDNISDEGKIITFSNSFGINIRDHAIYTTITTNKGNSWVNTNASVSDTKWHKLAVTFSSATGKVDVYLDGVKITSSGGFSGEIQKGNLLHDFHIGSHTGGSFPGLVDNVAFLTGALSASEIKDVQVNGQNLANVVGSSIGTGAVTSISSQNQTSSSNNTIKSNTDTDTVAAYSASSNTVSGKNTTKTDTDVDSGNGASGKGGASFASTIVSNQTTVAFANDMRDGVSLSAKDVNGIIDQAYLSGKTSKTFIVDVLETLDDSKNNNSLGVYEFNAKGRITDVRIIDDNVQTDDGPITVSGVNAHKSLGFFIIQKGYDRLDQSILNSSNLTLVPTKHGIHLYDNGKFVSKKIFISHDSSANYDRYEHVNSASLPDGSGGAVIGFEDLHKNGADNDYQDVIFSVHAVGADELSFG